MAVVDHASVLVELRAVIAEKPNWRRQDLLVLFAQLEAQHRVEEDELDRALRLTMPQLLDLLFNRAPALVEAARHLSDDMAAGDATEGSHAGVVRPSLAAV